MSEESATQSYLVLSRGRWDKERSPEEIQAAIDEFYRWIDAHVEAGRMQVGQRLARPAKLVSKGVITDGPFAEAKEVIGGYWFILARNLDEAASIAAGNPCIAMGLSLEIRPIELEQASAYALTNETPT